MSNDTTAKIGEVLPSEDPGCQEERRCEVRRSYPAIQFVAFHNDSQTPTKENVPSSALPRHFDKRHFILLSWPRYG